MTKERTGEKAGEKRKLGDKVAQSKGDKSARVGKPSLPKPDKKKPVLR